jgi:hypothetical protein
MAKKSIGDLHATVTADAVQFVNEFKRADNEARRSAANIKKTLSQQFGDEIGKTGKKFALGFLGGAALTRIISEISEVARNIDNIPGVPASTIESIRTMNYEFAQTRLQLQQGVARAAGWVANIGTGLGFGLASMVYGTDAAAESFNDFNKEAAAFARMDVDRQLGDLASEFERLKVSPRESLRNKDLEKETEQLTKFAATGVVALNEYKNAKLEALAAKVKVQGGASQADIDQASIEVLKNQITLQRNANELGQKYEDTLKHVAATRQADYVSTLSTSQAMEYLNTQLRVYSQRLGEAYSKGDKEKVVELTKDIGEVEHKIFTLKHSVRTASQEMRDTFVSNFQDISSELTKFITGGGADFKGFIKRLADEIIGMAIKLAIINPLLNGIFGGASGWSALPAMFNFGGGKASGGTLDPGKWHVVGENGPEILAKGTSGTVIPAGATANLMRGQSGDTYVIDARGADQTSVARLERLIMQLNGSIEKRAVAAVNNDTSRRGRA